MKFGFDDVYEVAKAAEIVSAVTRSLMKSGKLIKPVISSACPAVAAETYPGAFFQPHRTCFAVKCAH